MSPLAWLVESLWRATWQGAIVVAAVWLVLFLLSRLPRINPPPAVRYGIWWAVCLQFVLRIGFVAALPLLTPTPHAPGAKVAISSQIGVPALSEPTAGPVAAGDEGSSTGISGVRPIKRKTPSEAARAAMARLTAPDPETEDTPKGPSAPSATGVKATAPGFDPIPYVGLIYAIGFAAGLLRIAIQWRKTHALVSRATPVEPARVQAALEALARSRPLPKARILASEAAPCPFLAGWWRPTIVLPKTALTELAEPELRMALAHEFTHLRRRDLWFATVPALAQTLFWFHPGVHLAIREAAAACEEACDREALAWTQDSPRAYAQFLVRMAQGGAAEPWSVAVGAAFNVRLLQRRITMLKHPHSKLRRPGLGLAALALLVSVPWTVIAQNPTTPPLPPAVSAPRPGQAPIPTVPPAAPGAIGIRPGQISAPKPPAIPASPASGFLPLPTIGLMAPAAARPVAPGSGSVKTRKVAGHLKVTVQFENRPADRALMDLFKATHVDYLISVPVGSAPITCSLTDAGFDKALATILSASGRPITYAYQGGLYEIRAKGFAGGRMMAAPAVGMAQTVDAAVPDAAGASVPGFIPTGNAMADGAGFGTHLGHIQFDQAECRQAIKTLAKQGRLSFTIDPSITGVVTCDLLNPTLETALQVVLPQVHATYRVTAGVYQFIPATVEGVGVADDRVATGAAPAQFGLANPAPGQPLSTVPPSPASPAEGGVGSAVSGAVSTGRTTIAPAGSLVPASIRFSQQGPIDEARNNLKQVALATIMYASDYDDVYPIAQATPAAQKQIRRYLKTDSVFHSPNPAGGSFRYNTHLAGAYMSRLPAPAETILWYDALPWPDQTHLVAFADGHVKSVDSKTWAKLKASLTKAYPKAPKPKPPTKSGRGARAN